MSTENSLLPNVLQPLPLGNIRPAGWLLNQLRIQAAGLSGHLDEFWPDIARSAWIGGDAEGWERAPYWLDGLVPLAFLLNDERLKAKVQHWLEYILAHQHEDGWFGPVLDAKYGYEHDPWPNFILLKVLTQYQEATDDPRVVPAMQRFLRRLQGLLVESPLKSWAKMRAADLLLSIYWLYRRTHEEWLLDLARLVQDQAYDWRTHFAHFTYTEKQPQWVLENHVVNHTMALKRFGVSYQLTHDESERQALAQAIATLDTYHGQVTGVISGDESLAGKNPSQGTELCAVVEYMFSLEMLLATFGDPALADRLEKITFNALPATFKPDMWAHQYVQQANQVICAIAEDRLYTNNGPDANLFGLEPHFGCCTANMHQGWPKFASHLWMRTVDHGLAAVAYAPCTVSTSVDGVPVRIEVRTNYPFEEDIQVRISVDRLVAFPLSLHIPAWATEAQVNFEDGSQQQAQAGTFHRIEHEWRGEALLTLHLPMQVKTQTRYHNSVSIERGPLVYALRIAEQWQQVRGELPHADWEVRPASAWNYGLAIDRVEPEHSCTVHPQSVDAQPFAPEHAPILLTVKGRCLPEWQIEHNAAGTLPMSPVTSSKPLEELTLVPYGCTDLRVSEFPVLIDSGQ